MQIIRWCQKLSLIHISLVLSFWHGELQAAGAPVDIWVLWLAVALALAAMVDYAVGAWKKLRKRQEQA